MSGAWLAERLNTEPPVSRGCSVVEILAILGGAVGLWLPLGGAIGWWQGAFQLGLAGGVVAIVLTMAVYLFAGYLFQQLHLWRADGHKDYGGNIYRRQAFLTPRYRAALEADLEWRARRGELQGRIRQLAPLPGHGYEPRRVEPLGAGRWRAWVDFAIDETVKGMPVKQTLLRYPLEVVRMEVDPEHNLGSRPRWLRDGGARAARRGRGEAGVPPPRAAIPAFRGRREG